MIFKKRLNYRHTQKYLTKKLESINRKQENKLKGKSAQATDGKKNKGKCAVKSVCRVDVITCRSLFALKFFYCD